MDLPAPVQISNDILGLKGHKGVLVAISQHGYYELRLEFAGRQHRVLLPIAQSAVVFRQPEPEFAAEGEIER